MDTCALGVTTEHGETVCPISGLVTSGTEVLSTTRNSDPHWKLVKVKEPRQKKRKTPSALPTLEKISQKTKEILRRLFFSSVRRDINRRFTETRLDKCKSRIEKHAATTKKEKAFLSLPKIMRICSNTMSGGLPYAILDEDEYKASADQCIHVIKQVWEKLVFRFYGPQNLHKSIIGAPSRPNTEYLILGTLYLMKTGYQCGDVVFLPYNAFVADNLPGEKDLKHFGFDVGRLKPGKDLLLGFYEKAAQLNMYIRIDDELPNPREEEPQTVFKPTTRGFYCRRCKHRFEDETAFDTHGCKTKAVKRE
jgi:hypothetical protein